MISKKDTIKISKFLSLVLRHRPETIGIELDEQGWTDVTILLQKISDYGKKIDLITLKQVVADNDKKRFAFDESGLKIRANQGHSVKVELGYTAQRPPDILYHGTVEKFLDNIFKIGLIKRKRHHVHLSVDLETAIKVGSRRGKPVVLKIDTKAMHQRGFLFYLSENGIWLTENVPINYLSHL